ncbi:AAA family ATPase [Pseudonocardia lacus]|uniref:AAA family ATPase n=1 Tax=Pseudonocardia lacus TaxID=2835865 RepID=UPI0027E2685E|nr:AAA family ATPase [Pseudonocardia lacus]
MTTLALSGRSLLLVAGMPGAGKSTLLRDLPSRPGLRVLDSDTYRSRMAAVTGPVPYAWYRPVVHAWHRLSVLAAAASSARVVVVHLPATAQRTRAAVAGLAALTGRDAHLVWLHVEPEEALRGQRQRGRVVPSASFLGHARRAATTTARLRAGADHGGWRSVTVLDRAAARDGLRLATAPPARAKAPVEHARSTPQ